MIFYLSLLLLKCQIACLSLFVSLCLCATHMLTSMALNNELPTEALILYDSLFYSYLNICGRYFLKFSLVYAVSPDRVKVTLRPRL
jgi:hypothetical protein